MSEAGNPRPENPRKERAIKSETLGPLEGTLLPALPLKNGVVWRDDDLIAAVRSSCPQLDTPSSKASEFGIGLVLSGMKSRTRARTVGCVAGHWRTSVQWKGRVRTPQGTLFRYVTGKGTGLVDSDETGKPVARPWVAARLPNGSIRMRGLCDLARGVNDAHNTKIFSEQGAEVAPIALVTELLELPIALPNGTATLQPVATLHQAAERIAQARAHDKRKHPYLPPAMRPAVCVRLEGCVLRSGDLEPEDPASDPTFYRNALEDARIFLATQKNNPNIATSWKEYLLTLAMRDARNLAILHAHNYGHRQKNPANFPLDGLLVDNESAVYSTSPILDQYTDTPLGDSQVSHYAVMTHDIARPGWQTDVWGAIPTLYLLRDDIAHYFPDASLPSHKEMSEVFFDTYRTVFLGIARHPKFDAFLKDMRARV